MQDKDITILIEKFSNLEDNLKESFNRIHARQDKIEQDTVSKLLIQEKFKVANKRIADLESFNKKLIWSLILSGFTFVFGLITWLITG